MSEDNGLIIREEIFDYTEENSNEVDEIYRQEIDEALILAIDADAAIVWRVGGKIQLLKKTYQASNELAEKVRETALSLGCSEDSIKNIDGNLLELSTYELYRAEINAGYYEDAGLYVISNRIYTEDDYVWMEIPGRKAEDAQSIYADSQPTVDDLDIFDDLDNEEAGEYVRENYVMTQAAPSVGDEPFLLNVYEEGFRLGKHIKAEPLVVNKINIDEPVLDVEIAYRNALCEASTKATCGWMILLHKGHFYIPVETFEDTINHETCYLAKIFNSYPVSPSSNRADARIGIELYGVLLVVAGIRYRKGYSVNWRKYIFDYALPKNFLENMPQFMDYVDGPFGLEKDTGMNMPYDGFIMKCDDEDEEDSSEDDEEDGDDENESPSNKTEG
ncbi:hypothetical protein J6D24_03070 [Candidatus Saccharibacteria bacterium]|nr:hypothetical protein [Candidatus Saccharibacteria bacterium]